MRWVLAGERWLIRLVSPYFSLPTGPFSLTHPDLPPIRTCPRTTFPRLPPLTLSTPPPGVHRAHPEARGG